jgi:nucleotide-binding universal stress UspA family protein
VYVCHVIGEKEVSEPGYSPTASISSLKKLIPRSAYDRCTPECIVEHGRAAETILQLAGRVNADLIVLGARKSSFWITYVKPGLTTSLLAEAKCPVLTVC